jgi:ABC-type multidrug transport system permease subunit
MLWGIVQAWCKLPGSVVLQLLTLCLLAVSGTAIGLLTSALARSEEVATALVPMIVIPQIILAGVIAPLTGLPRWLAKAFVTVHWGGEALERLLPESDLSLLGNAKMDWRLPFVVVLSHFVIAAVASVVVLARSSDPNR